MTIDERTPRCAGSPERTHEDAIEDMQEETTKGPHSLGPAATNLNYLAYT